MLRLVSRCLFLSETLVQRLNDTSRLAVFTCHIYLKTSYVRTCDPIQDKDYSFTTVVDSIKHADILSRDKAIPSRVSSPIFNRFQAFGQLTLPYTPPPVVTL